MTNKTPERHNEPLPNNWSAGIGETSSSYYDMWYYHNDDEYEVHIYWDEGNPYTVELIPVRKVTKDGRQHGYAQEADSFNDLKEAEKYAWELMEKYV